MGASFLITLREGLEMALIIAIVLAYLRKTRRTDLFRDVWIGVGAALAVCLVAGVAFDRLVGDFEGTTEAVIEGLLAISAAVVLTWMIFWMRANARGIASHLHGRVDAAIAGASGLVALAFFTVGREGFETVLFLVGARVNETTGWEVVIGGLSGLVVAVVIAAAIYLWGRNIDLRLFFQWTGALLILFAAGLFSKGVHELAIEATHATGTLADSLWTIEHGFLANGWTHDFLGGMFGWTNDEAGVLRVLAYFAYLVPVAWMFFAGTREAPRAPARGTGAADDAAAVRG